eukprot:g7350.t1
MQASEAQALREEVHRLTKAREDQEVPALRAYLPRFRQSNGIFPDRNKDEEKRLRTRGIDAQPEYIAPSVDILPKLLEHLEIHEPDLFLLNIPRNEDQ